ncbi:acetyl-CoA hydrolase [Desulfosporosinus orientis DSM 765]|uniref:Acetyl-CoA hydrolase n=1 Tax=Desulfosporosinus orientis (strain ATCC 19365 / DSM 765 / NCIMB 8382 / VKM B-1628 / Singapore I) TaxID=768706 RepID=G7WGT2_DESOD|nr:acetyl-CoA hydrolase/transferase C-terminal domain-containing protein [Desulfosporosinus orientis]AET68518.1 acetyl-CoA hydrolase [Desulfosporosinus orientis DSM 765]
MDVKELYKSKLMSVADAVKLVKSGDRVEAPFANGTPVALMNALNARTELQDITIVGGVEMWPLDVYKPDRNPNFDVTSTFLGPATRAPVNSGVMNYLPIRLGKCPEVVRRHYPIDVVMRVVSPMDEHGFFSSGVQTDHTYAICKMPTTRHIIVQVNENMPRTWGDNQLHISEIAAVVEYNQPMMELPNIPLTPEDRLIGEAIAEMIEDGSTIQLGIGGIPNAVGSFLKDKHDLGIHTEMFSDAMLDLYEMGVITGKKKTLKPEKWVGTFVLGSNRLYKFVNDNPMTELHSCEFTNNPRIISMNDKMISINTAMEVSLTGEVNSESQGCYQYSGAGGFADFIDGCWQSKGGKSFIALYSTYKDKEGNLKSRINPYMTYGAPVSAVRADVEYVVTEYGVACMHGKNIKQRAKSLISIAHPDFRDQLTFEARKARFID